jgi:multiple sugar transport system ATP-binding protein
LEEITSGQLLLGGKDVTRVPPGKRDVAMVFQDYALFPHMDVTDNISYPLRIQKVAKPERRDRAVKTGGGLGLDTLMDRRPGQLSGGQQQRVALARAIAYQPSVFLFDEPLSNLDARLRLEARTFLKRLQHELRVTTVFVTHDQAEALAMADTIAVMEAGHIRQIGSPSDVFHRPANVFVANFIGSTPMNLVPGSAFGSDRVPEGDEMLIGFRPEYTKLEDNGRYALRGTVSIVENLGASMLVSVTCGDHSVQALVPEGEEPPVDTDVTVSPADRRVLRYRASDGELLEPDRVAAAVDR